MTKKQRYFETKIRELTLSGVRQSDIARILCVSRITVRHFQRQLGLPTRQQREVPSGETYQRLMHAIDEVFPDGLPFTAEYDSRATDVLLSAFRARTPGYFDQASKGNIEELRKIIIGSLHIKRMCSDSEHGMVH